MANDKIIVGRVRISKGTKLTKQYEVASWYQTMTVDRDMEVTLYAQSMGSDGRIRDTSYMVNGFCDGSNFTSLYMGIPVGEGNIDKDIGQPISIWEHPREYNIAEYVLDNPYNKDAKYIIYPQYRVRKSYFMSNGELHYTNGIFLKENDLVGTLQEEMTEYIIEDAKIISDKVLAVIISEEMEELHLVEVVNAQNNEIIPIAHVGYDEESKIYEMFRNYVNNK